MLLEIEAGEELPAPGKGLGQGVEKQGFAETLGAGEKIVAAVFGEPCHEWCFVHVVAVFAPDLGKGLDADGQFLALHGKASWRSGWKKE